MNADQNKIREKIKGLLRLASNEGATEAEAESAMNAALALMAKYQITVNLDEANDEKTIAGDWQKGGWVQPWHIYAAMATALLYSCESVIGTDEKYTPGKGYREVRSGAFQFIGRESAVEMCALTLPWIIAQVEQLYRAELRAAMSLLEAEGASAKKRQGYRAEFRKTFKADCIMTVYHRVWGMKSAAKKSDAAAIEFGATNALSLINKEEQLKQEIKDKKTSMDLIPAKVSAPSYGVGSERGAAAGNRVQLNHTIKEEVKRLT